MTTPPCVFPSEFNSPFKNTSFCLPRQVWTFSAWHMQWINCLVGFFSMKSFAIPVISSIVFFQCTVSPILIRCHLFLFNNYAPFSSAGWMLQKAVYKYSFQLLNKLISTLFIHISCELYLIRLMNDLLAGMFTQMKDFKVQAMRKKSEICISNNKNLYYKP